MKNELEQHEEIISLLASNNIEIDEEIKEMIMQGYKPKIIAGIIIAWTR
jgi:hypothetical protein